MSLSSSPPKVFVHIGLLKTATTTLQHEFFPKFNNSKIVYIGLRTPRRQKQSLLFEHFDKAVRLGEDIEQALPFVSEGFRGYGDISLRQVNS